MITPRGKKKRRWMRPTGSQIWRSKKKRGGGNKGDWEIIAYEVGRKTGEYDVLDRKIRKYFKKEAMMNSAKCSEVK